MMKLTKFLTLCILIISIKTFGQTPFQMKTGDYIEDFGNISTWTNPFGSGPVNATRWSPAAVNATGNIPDGKRVSVTITNFPTQSTTGGVQRGTDFSMGLQSIVLLATGASDNSSAVAIDLFLDFTGRTAGNISFDWAEVNNSTGNRNGSLRIYTSIDGSVFDELLGAAVLNITNNSPANGQVTNIALPSSFNNCSTGRIRFYYYNGAGGSIGSRPKISIDNILVTSTELLPVELISFSGAAAGSSVNLKWNTATEVNNNGFDVERSNTPLNPLSRGENNLTTQEWKKVGFVAGAGNSNSTKEYSYIDKVDASGKYYYRLKQIDNDGKYVYSDVIEVNVAGSALSLSQNYPNPCNPEATISYSLAENCHVSLKIYDMMGREVASLVNEDKPAGKYDVKFNGSSLASGMYVYKLTAGTNTLTRKLSLLK